MKMRIRRRHVLFAIIAVLGTSGIVVEAYLISPGFRVRSVGTLEAVGADGELARLLADENIDVRAAALAAVERRGPEAVTALIRALDHPDAPHRSGAAHALGRIGPPARAALPALKTHMVRDEDAYVREIAAVAAGRVGCDDPDTVNELRGLMSSGNEAECIAGTQAVYGLGEVGKSAVPRLIALLKHANPLVREASAEALGKLGWAAKMAIPALLETLADADPRVRGEAQEALEGIIHSTECDEPATRERVNEAIARSRFPAQP